MPAQGIDVLIRGAGPVGCALALALQGSRLEAAILGRTESRAAFRPIALSHASRLILERLDAWRGLAATPIEAIHMLLAGRIDIALVPEPAATAAILKAAASGRAIHRAIDMQVEWGKVTGLGPIMPQAGLAFTDAFLQQHADMVEPMLAAIAEATAAVTARPSLAAGHAASALELPWPVIEKSILENSADISSLFS